MKQKMKDYRIINPVHKAILNKVSITCSKSLMSIWNKSGLAYSYAKDLKDSKVSLIVWNAFRIRTSLEKTPSNMHWIECDNLETMLKSTNIMQKG